MAILMMRIHTGIIRDGVDGDDQDGQPKDDNNEGALIAVRHRKASFIDESNTKTSLMGTMMMMGNPFCWDPQ